MRFEDFTEEEKEYFSTKFDGLINQIEDDCITIEDEEGIYDIVKYECHKGTLYMIREEDDPTVGLIETGSGVWMQAPSEVYYEITKESLDEYINTPANKRYPLREYAETYK